MQSFQNGYTFSQMVIDNSTDHDENGNELSHYKGISLTYEKTGEDRLYISTEQEIHVHDERVRQPDLTKTIDGIEVEYFLDTYKWVTPDYELTEDDKANMEKDNYFISVGADEVSENLVSGVCWVQDGVWYHIGNIYGKTEPEVLFQMAEELIMSE